MAELKLSNLMMSVPVPATLAAIAAGRPAVPRKEPAARRLHVLNGDSAADLLRLSGVQGEITLSADVLHEGPAPAGLLPERWRKVRARYLAEQGYDDYDRCLANLTEWDRALEGYRSFDEVVIWLEHDLFDQLQLLRLLDWFGSRDDLGGGRTRVSLICIGSFPGIEPFHGLGQLSPEQMASLLDRREPVTGKQVFLARHAWRAFCSPEPIGLEVALRRDTSALPFLADAIQRHLEEFPWTRDGLSRTERQALLGIDSGFDTFESLFRAVQALEPRPFLGDSSFLRCLRVLASSPMPLIRLEPGPGGLIRNLHLGLTGSGREVLEGHEDWVHLHGVDRWLGGVHLHGREAPWRWDGDRSRLVPAAIAE